MIQALEQADMGRIPSFCVASRADVSLRIPAFTARAFDNDPYTPCIFNSGREDLSFELPPIEGRRQRRVVHTGMESPNEIADSGQETAAEDNTIIAKTRSVVVLISK